MSNIMAPAIGQLIRHTSQADICSNDLSFCSKLAREDMLYLAVMLAPTLKARLLVLPIPTTVPNWHNVEVADRNGRQRLVKDIIRNPLQIYLYTYSQENINIDYGLEEKQIDWAIILAVHVGYNLGGDSRNC